jgi:hypothetical protein
MIIKEPRREMGGRCGWLSPLTETVYFRHMHFLAEYHAAVSNPKLWFDEK